MPGVDLDNGIITVAGENGRGFSVEASRIRKLVYFPGASFPGIWDDDALFIYAGDGFREACDIDGERFPAGWDHAIWGADIMPFLDAVRKSSSYDVQPVLDAIAEKAGLFPGKARTGP